MSYGDYESRARGPPRYKARAENDDPPCRACGDFQSWFKSKGGVTVTALPKDCPLDREALGRHSWSFLHTTAAYFPKKPTAEQQSGMLSFLKLFAQFYPCDHCAADFRKEMDLSPPNVSSVSLLAGTISYMYDDIMMIYISLFRSFPSQAV